MRISTLLSHMAHPAHPYERPRVTLGELKKSLLHQDFTGEL